MVGAEEESVKGTLEKMFTVWCGGCSEWEYVKTAADAKRREWANTRSNGWLCKKCKAKSKETLARLAAED